MSPNEYEYREVQKINERLRCENHLLRLLDELKRETNDTSASTNVPVPGSQDTRVGDVDEKNDGLGSAGTESQDTLVGVVGEDAGPSNDDPGKDDTEETGQKMDVDTHGDKTEGSHKQPGDKKPGNKHPKDNEDNEEEEEEEENSQYDESNASDVQSESTEASSASDEDSKDEIQPEVQLLRELHRCNPLAHRNAVISMYKRDKLRTSTMRDNLHIGLHRELQRCFDNKFYSVGYCTLDASLYMACESNPAKRTDVWVYQHLYGLHPALVSCIDYQPTLRLLDRHADMQISIRKREWDAKFMRRFKDFIESLERACCLSGYLDTDIPDEQGDKRYVASMYKACVEALGR